MSSLIDADLEREGADWIAEMVSDQLGGFVPSEFCDLVMATEQRVRRESDDPEMDHATMTARVLALFEADPTIPTQDRATSAMLIFEVLHWEDEFRAMSGAARSVRPSPPGGPAR